MKNPANQKILFEEKNAFNTARKEFITLCGFRSDTEKHQKMLAHGMQVRERGLSRINIRALVSAYGPEVIEGPAFRVNGVSVQCDVLSITEKEKIKKVFFYLLTVGECGCESEAVLEKLYADLWGTAYVNAAFQLLSEKFQRDFVEGDLLSDTIGPGYYGMPTEEVKKFFAILDGDAIGVSCLSSGLMVPVKSCAGILLAMEDGSVLLEQGCRTCVGNRQGCAYCRMRKR